MYGNMRMGQNHSANGLSMHRARDFQEPVRISTSPGISGRLQPSTFFGGTSMTFSAAHLPFYKRKHEHFMMNYSGSLNKQKFMVLTTRREYFRWVHYRIRRSLSYRSRPIYKCSWMCLRIETQLLNGYTLPLL